MILFDTLHFYLGIIKAQKVIEDVLKSLTDPTKAKPEKNYTKKCECEKISDDL